MELTSAEARAFLSRISHVMHNLLEALRSRAYDGIVGDADASAAAEDQCICFFNLVMVLVGRAGIRLKEMYRDHILARVATSAGAGPQTAGQPRASLRGVPGE